MDKYNDTFKDVVERTAIRVNKSLKVSIALKGKKTTPSIKDRIAKLVNDVRALTGKEVLTASEEDEMMLNLRQMARDIKAVCRADGVAVGDLFHELDKKYQLYYCLMLEQRAARNGIYLMHCKDQWAAFALLAKTFKTSSDNAKRKKDKADLQKKQAGSVCYYFIQL